VARSGFALPKGAFAWHRSGFASAQGGFAYYGVLFTVLVAALAGSVGAHLLGNSMRREKELELMTCGDEIRRAIESYHAKNSSGMYPFPSRLEWLERDPHQLTVLRYLRRVCRDPMQEREAESRGDAGGWVAIRDANGQVIGVHSSSLREPLKRAGFVPLYQPFAQATRYADWRFIAAGGVAATDATGRLNESRNFIPAPGVLMPGAPAQAAQPGLGAAGAARPAVPRAEPNSTTAAAPLPPTEGAPPPRVQEPRTDAPDANAGANATAAEAAAAAAAPVAQSAGAPAAAQTAGAPAEGGVPARPPDNAAPVPAPAPGAESTGGVQPFVLRPPSGW
jgi:hypothetical protein